ncbi:MAG: aminotransferase class III-fold pyridoxal phosphate-dependent enzyme [Nocardioidaceae bacterium]|nr:aminotransferase class III-fold pyridoxal phosphate-dependent enzyme [Nocardioidaceae bacterium]
MPNTIEEEHAAHVAAALFGLRGDVRRLDGEVDLNFLVTSADERVVLKLHRPGTDLAELELQDQVLLRLACAGLRVATPVPVPTAAGELTTLVPWTDGSRPARALTWIEGTPWPVGTADPTLLHDLGARIGELDRALAGYHHPAEGREALPWRITAAAQVAPYAEEVDEELRDLVRAVFREHATSIAPALADLPEQVVHHDLNEHNIVLGADGSVAGFIDFGDVARVPRIAELAVAAAYAVQGVDHPEQALVDLAFGYHQANPLAAAELAVLLDLVRLRLATSIAMSAHQFARSPGNAYLLISQEGVREALVRLSATDPVLLHCRLRDALGFEANPLAREVRQHLESGRVRPVPLVAPVDRLAGAFDRPYGDAVPGTDEVRVDRGLAVIPGAEVRAPLDGEVTSVTDDGVVLRHRADTGPELGIALSGLEVDGLCAGDRVRAGDLLGRASTTEGVGYPAAQVRVQLCALPGVGGEELVSAVPEAELDLWRSVFPDPNLLLGDPQPVRRRPVRTDIDLLRRRRTNFSTALGLSYADPAHVVRGEGAHLVDRDGRRWLDLVNNVAHVGHAHPRVVAAAHAQAQVLNTNTRYLHASVVEYARRLVELFPDPLHVCFLVNSGSEANDLALRLARAHTGQRDVLVLDHAYHGNLTSQIDLSPYKFNRAGGLGQPHGTWVCELPDVYRGRLHELPVTEQVAGYAVSVAEQLDGIRAAGRAPAAFFVESLQSCGGQIVLPEGYLASTFALAGEAGAVTVADEIQVGLGRVGSHLWGFELGGVVPDIVTLGKPLGNGHPLAAVVTTPEIARSFANGMEWFNTFGGNPVSAEVGLAVLDVLRDERLQANASDRGRQLKEGLARASAGHPLIGDVRGEGLFLGIELSHEGRAPATAHAGLLKEAIKARGAMVSTDGPDENVIKIKPPMVLSEEDCAWFVDVFEDALGEVEKRVG